MAGSSINTFRRLWYRWKSLELPWRRQRLCGYDLTGTTFWEFRDALNQGRMRRIAKYPRSTHYSEVSISPSWIQWLRHTRETAPTFQEQQLDVQRQIDMKTLAAQADERWNSQERFADKPKMRTLGEGTGVEMVPRDTGGYVARGVEVGGTEGAVSGAKGMEDAPREARERAERAGGEGNVIAKEKAKVKGPSPWDRHKRSNPGDEWQPEAWQPPPKRR